MIYRVKSKKSGPIQLALRTLDGTGTHVVVLPARGVLDIPEERYNEQITNLEAKGDIVIEQVYKK